MYRKDLLKIKTLEGLTLEEKKEYDLHNDSLNMQISVCLITALLMDKIALVPLKEYFLTELLLIVVFFSGFFSVG